MTSPIDARDFDWAPAPDAMGPATTAAATTTAAPVQVGAAQGRGRGEVAAARGAEPWRRAPSGASATKACFERFLFLSPPLNFPPQETMAKDAPPAAATQ